MQTLLARGGQTRSGALDRERLCKLLGLLSSHERDRGTSQTHVAILAAARPVEAIA